MVGTRNMEAVLTAAHDAGAKVVLVGDRRQLASIAGARALRAVANMVVRSAVMTEVRCQEVDWQKAAIIVMARGDSEAGMRAYAMHNRLELVSGTEAAQERTIEAWRELRQAYGEDVLGTRRNADAADLNRRALALLKQEARLGPDIVALPAIDRADKRVDIALAVGDRLRFGETLPQHSIRNGNRATVRAITAKEAGKARIAFDLDDGRRLDLDWGELTREPRYDRKRTQPRIVHAYAGTAHSVQGRSAATSIVYIARQTDAREIYVSLSRHRHDSRTAHHRHRRSSSLRLRRHDPPEIVRHRRVAGERPDADVAQRGRDIAEEQAHGAARELEGFAGEADRHLHPLLFDPSLNDLGLDAREHGFNHLLPSLLALADRLAEGIVDLGREPAAQGIPIPRVEG